ncbi:MAG: 3-dehydroquinate synthase [Phycisphaerae bacterium]|nr:3-dehydroquinate synthase [Phycisphaerae bacterium]
MITVNVNLASCGYPIRIGSGLLDRAGDEFTALTRGTRASIVTDANVGPLYAARLADSLSRCGVDSAIFTIRAGEAAKSMDSVRDLYDRLAERRHARGEPVIALGGGVVGDVTGFVAATWMRGVPLIQIPTTLEADLDAAVGGKTAVNHAAGKNLIGAFHQPELVLIDVDCLSTLANRDFTAALAESVKHAVIEGDEFVQWHERHVDQIRNRDSATTIELIRRNCETKAAIVASDERERSVESVGRAALNLGHTMGHALEVASGYELRHGEAVSLGLIVAMDLAVRWVGFDEAIRQRIERLIGALGLTLRVKTALNRGVIAGFLEVDKKRGQSGIRFVLPRRLGELCWHNCPGSNELSKSLDRID